MRRLLAALFSVIVLAVLAVAAIPLFISSDWIRDRVVSEVEAATGLRLALDGKVSLGVFPSLALEAFDVGLSVPDAPEFARVGEIRFGLSMSALLDRRIDITGITLVTPEIDLAIDADGKANWLPVTEEGEAVPVEGPADPNDLPFTVSVARIEIEGGTLTYTDERSGTTETVTDIALVTALPDLASPLEIKGQMGLRGFPTEVAATITTPLGLIRENASDVSATLGTGATRVKIVGKLTPAEGTLFNAVLDIDADDPAALAAGLGIAPPPFAKIAVRGRVAAGQDRVEITNIKAVADEFTINGEVGIQVADVPRVDARFVAAELDIDKLTAKLAAAPAATTPAATEDAAAATPGAIDLGGLSFIDIGVDLRVRQLTAAALGEFGPLSNVRLVAVAEKGKIVAVLDDLRIAGGKLGATFNGGQDGDVVAVTGKVKLSDVRLGLVRKLADTKMPMAGTVGADLDISARGATSDALTSSLSVTGKATLREGAVGGLGLGKVFQDPAASRLTDLSLDVAIAGITEPVRITGKAGFRGEALSIDATVPPLDIAAGKTFAGKAVVKSKRISVSFDGKVNPATGALAGSIDVASPSLKAILAVLNRDVANVPPGEVRVRGRLETKPDLISLTGGRYTLVETDMAGDLSVATGERTKISGQLSGATVDLGAIIGGAAGAGAPDENDNAQPSNQWSADPIRLAGLRGFDTDLQISTKALRFGRIRTGAVNVGIKLDRGKLVVDLPKIVMYGGSGSGRVALDASEGTPDVALKLDVKGVDANKFLAATASFKQISGKADVAIDVTSNGNTVRRIMNRLNGTASINAVDGAIAGLDLRDLLRTLLTRIVTGFDQGKDAKTTFKRLSASFKITDGIARNDDFLFSELGLKITGAGNINIGNRLIDYRVEPKLTADKDKFNLMAMEIPVAVRGSWAKPRFEPEIFGGAKKKPAPAEKKPPANKKPPKPAATDDPLGALIDGGQ